jgi:predicted ATPase
MWSSLEFLSLLIDQVSAGLLILLTCRLEFRPPWSPRSRLTHLTLGHLGRAQVETMLEHITGGKALPAEVVQQIVTKTDGVPLFVEELTKAILESGLLQEREHRYELTGPLPLLAIPATLHDSLMARLDRLGIGKEVAQLSATLGRTFPYELLQAVAQLDESTLQQALTRLVEAELLYQRGVPPRATYFFKHALVQDAAYTSLLRSTRQQLHARAATVLEAQFPSIMDSQPETLAYHYTAAGFWEPAIVYWQRAGQRACARSANVEAISHLTAGLNLLENVPDIPARAAHELTLRLTLGTPLMALKGWASPEVENTFTRAHEICQQIGETPHLFPALVGLSIFYLLRAELQTTGALTMRLLRLAQHVQDHELLLVAHTMRGCSWFWQGAIAPARESFEHALVYYNPQQHRRLAFVYGQDLAVVSRSHMGFVLWWLGYPHQALEQHREAVALARAVPHPFSEGFALTFQAIAAVLQRQPHTVQLFAEATMRLANEQGFPHWLADGMIFHGWVQAMQGKVEEGKTQIRQGLAIYRAIGSALAQPFFLILLAETHGRAGEFDEGLSILDEALALGQSTEERCWEAELYRLKGEFLLTQTGGGAHAIEKAEAWFEQALAIARRQQAKSWELRAATSLSRLWQQQGKCQKAHDLLAPIYGWFTEGFDTTDLQEAKALLEELA